MEVFGPDPAPKHMWQDAESDLDFAQDTQISGQFVQVEAARGDAGNCLQGNCEKSALSPVGAQRVH